MGRKSRLGAQIGLYVDMVDVYLPIIVLAPAAMYFEPDDLSTSASRILTAVIFVATILGRPLGALIFGYLSDRTGRRRMSIIALIGIGATTLGIAVLPGYQVAGITAVILLIALRFIGGIFLGGQYTAAVPLALESSGHARRGLNGAIIMTGFPLAYCSIALVTFGMLQVVPAAGLGSPYVEWGWRIPFVLGGLLALGWALWYSRNVSESQSWKDTPKSDRSPVLELFQGANLRGFAQIFILMSGVWLAFNMVGAVLPGLLKQHSRLADTEVTMTLVIAYAVLTVAYLCAGLLSQRIGRRPFFLIQGTIIMLVAPVLLWLLVANVVTGVSSIGAVTVALVVVVVSTYAVVTTYIVERFRTGVRSSGYGLGYTTAVILPAFYAFYQAGLSNFMPFEYTPLVLLAVGGALILLGAALGPETRDVDLSADARKASDAVKGPHEAPVAQGIKPETVKE